MRVGVRVGLESNSLSKRDYGAEVREVGVVQQLCILDRNSQCSDGAEGTQKCANEA